MTTDDEIHKLIVKIEQLLAMLEPLEKCADKSAMAFANGVRHRLDELRKMQSSEDNQRLVMRLLDIVPTAKDLDSIGFRLDLYPAIDALSSDLEAEAATIAQSLSDTL